ncbi:glutamine--tRNA ligase [Sodalis-like secondary symbiont of Drepanosiphum platanoidis]|uniref:glutamine--tRNA ligase n=1 Tax=Sodalis-like secondary symbiont of Drepanosiphum platanoidis TaxID=2994493 RepID=UPI003463C4F5
MNIYNNFIINIIKKELKKNKNKKICTRFPPEPNGYLHIGHAKSIYLNFNIAKKFNGKCNLRFDDTNPVNETKNFINSIKKDIKWLGFKWNGSIKYSSNYFDLLYKYAIFLIKKNFAYVDELSSKQIKKYKGTLNTPGINSPYRNRTIEENIKLFNNMKNGKYIEGKLCLRAKIDMKSPRIIMRDPVLYRIKYFPHHQTGNKWCIYPTYDFSHCISDYIEGITHSLCTLEFQDNRELYNWILNKIFTKKYPKQYEFSRLNIQFTVLSKRKLKKLVEKKIVSGWDDPRMPTISGLKKRGYTSKSIKNFCKKIGITKQNNLIEFSLLESCIREELNISAPRIMAVINPLKIIFINLPKNYKEKILMKNHPFKSKMGTRKVYFNKEIYIDNSDFLENATKKYKRLVLGKEVRLRYSYVIKAEKIKKDKNGIINVVYCSCDLKTLNKKPNNRKVKGIIHWVSAIKNLPAKFYLYENLFLDKNPNNSDDFLKKINKNSLSIKHGFIEKINIKNKLKKYFQFEREGYFYLDNKINSKKLRFNRIVKLKNSYINKK